MASPFLYSASAVGGYGYVTLPVQDVMPNQASVALCVGPGIANARVDGFKHLSFASIGSVRSQVIGTYSDLDESRETLSAVVAENVNVLDVVTCDRISLRLASKYPEEANAEPAFVIHGTHFENLRIAGYPIDPDFASGLFNLLNTWGKLNGAYETDLVIRKQLSDLAMYPREGDKLPVDNGIFGCTVARIPDALPGGLTKKGQGIYVENFGTVYLGQFYISALARRMRMLYVDLGCTVEGYYGFVDGDLNGNPYP